MLRFFGVASAQAWERVCASQATLFRVPAATLKANHGNLAAWLRKGEIEAIWTECGPFDSGLFRETLRTAHELTRENLGTYLPALQDACAKAGVAVVLVPALPSPASKPGPSGKPRPEAVPRLAAGGRIIGAVRWLGPEKALIQVNPAGFETEDDFWFTFLHQAGHLLLHGKRRGFLESAYGAADAGGARSTGSVVRSESGGDTTEEDEADRFAFNLYRPSNTGN